MTQKEALLALATKIEGLANSDSFKEGVPLDREGAPAIEFIGLLCDFIVAGGLCPTCKQGSIQLMVTNATSEVAAECLCHDA